MAVLAPILAAALAAAQHPAVIVNPDWLHKPTGEEVEAHYPQLMLEMQIEGEAILRCDVTIDGDAVNCSVAFESPRGLGFGPAAISLAPLMKFTPKKVDGAAVAGGSFRAMIRFRLEGPTGGAKASVMPPAGVDARSRSLALQAVTMADSPVLQQIVIDHLAQVEARTAAQGDAASLERMMKLYVAAFRQLEPSLDQLHANLILGRLTPAQIEAGMAFMQTPSGRAMIAKAGDPGLQLTSQQSADIQAFADTEAGHAFLGVMNETAPKVVAELNSQVPALAAATLKAYCTQPGACPVHDTSRDHR